MKTVEEFENIIVKSNVNGSNVRIKDVARVELGAENYSSAVRIGESDVAMISISQLPEANTIDLVNRIEKKMEILSKNFQRILNILLNTIQQSLYENPFMKLLVRLFWQLFSLVQ